ncbi:MAG: TonB-dependent receptor domain-containing protein [Flavobacteriales bacterium]
MIKSLLFTGCFLLLFLLSSHAQQSTNSFTISGLVMESGSAETLPGVVIVCAEPNVGAVSNAFGFYSLTLPQGPRKITFSFVGFTAVESTIDLTKDMELNISLSNVASTGEVEIIADKEERISEDSRMSTISIPIDQIKNIPALLGEKDVLKVIQLMPGVQKGSEGSSGFYVRGGGPDQNLIMLDDATVYNANHLFGFFSLFNGDALKSVELTKGGFPARYGGRLSSVLEMRMKDGNKESIHGEAGIGLLSSRLTLEGPVKKGKSSFLVSGRRTYFDLLMQPFVLAATDGEVLGGYFFYDFNAKYNHILDDKNRLFVSGYFGKDKFYAREKDDDYLTKTDFNWGNATATARWNHIYNPKLFSNTSLIYTNYKFEINYLERDEDDEEEFSLKYFSGIQDVSLKYDLDFIPNPNHYIRAGVLMTRHLFRPSATVIKGTFEEDNVNVGEKVPSYENGLYLEDDWSITELLKVNFGLRLSHYNAQKKNYLRPEPRISGRYMIQKDLSVKASYALMNQYVHLLSNTGVGLPTDLWVPATSKVGPQQSVQYALGLAKDIPDKGLTVSLEGYYKTMEGVISYVEGASFLDVDESTSGEERDPLAWQENITIGKGKSYGAEFLVQRKFGKLTGWVGYTLSWTKLQFDELNFGREFYARYDRRHDVSVVGIYKLSERLTISATWVYGTGQAISLPLASFDPPAQIGSISQNGPQSYFYAEDYGAKNDFRMKAFHKLDVGLQWHKKLKRCEKTFELGFYNLYNRKNPFYYYLDTQTVNGVSDTKLMQASLFPIIPSVSWSYKW